MTEGSTHGPTGGAGHWLNVTQAARQLGWPRERLRSLARRGKVQTRRMNTGELLVHVTPELAAQAQAEPLLTHGPTDRSDGPDPWAGQEIDRLRDQVAGLEASLAEAMGQVANLRVDLATAQAEREAARAVAVADVEAARRTAEEAIAAREELIAELRRTLEHERARADRLEAEARRPWWRRWLDRT